MIKIKNSQFRVLIIINLLLALLIFADYLIPFNHTEEEKFSSFYRTVKETPGFKSKSSSEYKNILECKTGNLYNLGKFPDLQYELSDGQNIHIVKTFIFSSVKSINVVNEKGNQILEVSFLSIQIVQILLLISVLITFLNIFFTNGFLDFALALASIFLYTLTLVYIFYF
ncbi:hypothetical protein FSS13T_18540 [Flavobacterium saliperosum S13]|uniref:Uncharacterized protein n=2 Tax=Flavobacterium saliperosum TaxID=329186 RepID=A0A1G4WB71_9FLAO|nr:hypothetical protein [Flavobacterium saliperosum]ESU25278.1 hypothetical protein FSS13T_18540 [Flavobacterium saliperosum S13]SCX19114.1 hypothetical protein SAMN02927925_02770 [Flavobacterium saliperosum]